MRRSYARGSLDRSPIPCQVVRVLTLQYGRGARRTQSQRSNAFSAASERATRAVAHSPRRLHFFLLG